MQPKYNYTQYDQTLGLRPKWWRVLFYNSLTKYIWKSKIFTTFVKKLEYILAAVIQDIKNIETYYRP